MSLEKNSNKLDIIDKFFVIWSFFIPITSFVLIPSVKGSLISYILAFISPLIILFKRRNFFKKYIIYFGGFAYIWLAFFCLSQLGNLVYNIDVSSLILVSDDFNSIKVFRSSIFTQSMYLIPCILLYLYCKFFYSKKWDKWIIYSGLLFSIIGIFFWIGFLITGQNIDFISNRVFGENYTIWYQEVYIMGMSFQRIQGLASEPSMYAFTILPYIIFSIHKKANKCIIFIMIISLIFAASTSGYLGIIVYLFCLLLFSKYNKQFLKKLFIIFLFLSVIYILFSSYINEIIEIVLLNKLTNLDDMAENYSGAERSGFMENHIKYWLDMDVWHMLFGIGFGVIRSTDFFSTLLVNVGFLGLILWLYFVLNRIKIKCNSFEEVGQNSILIVLSVIMMISVPEFSFLSFWLFLGIIKSNNNIEER